MSRFTSYLSTFFQPVLGFTPATFCLTIDYHHRHHHKSTKTRNKDNCHHIRISHLILLTQNKRLNQDDFPEYMASNYSLSHSVLVNAGLQGRSFQNKCQSTTTIEKKLERCN